VIVLFLGLSGSGKTTAARNLLSRVPRSVILSPDKIFDRINHLSISQIQKLEGLQQQYNLIRLEPEGAVDWKALSILHDTTFLIDDLPVFTSRPGEKDALAELVPLWRRARVNAIITAHLPRTQVPRLLRVMANVIFWFGPLYDDSEIDILYSMRNLNIEGNIFYENLRHNPVFNPYRIK